MFAILWLVGGKVRELNRRWDSNPLHGGLKHLHHALDYIFNRNSFFLFSNVSLLLNVIVYQFLCHLKLQHSSTKLDGLISLQGAAPFLSRVRKRVFSFPLCRLPCSFRIRNYTIAPRIFLERVVTKSWEMRVQEL